MSGTVITLEGKPVPGAKVSALCDLNHPHSVETGTDGHFVLDNVKAGEVFVDASKPSEGYADSMFTFYDASQTDTSQRYVKIVAGQETKNVVIRIGPRCATLHLDISGKNGKLIPVQLAFTRPDVPGPYVTSAPAGGDILVPPVPFKMTIKAPGYEDYEYSQTSDRQDWMHLKSGDSIRVSVSMRSN